MSGALETMLDEEVLLAGTFWTIPKTLVIAQQEGPAESCGELLETLIPGAQACLTDGTSGALDSQESSDGSGAGARNVEQRSSRLSEVGGTWRLLSNRPLGSAPPGVWSNRSKVGP